MDIFLECREAVSAEAAALLYGMEVRRHKTCCIFHPDRHPSMSFYRGGYKCFSCGASGSSIDLTMRLFDLSPLEAVKKLDADLSLGLDFGQQSKTEKTYRRFCMWRVATIQKLDTAALACAVHGDAEASAALTEAFNVLVGENLEAQMELYGKRKAVETLCQSLTSSMRC